jgi:ankyrin repeat protein
MLVEERRCTGGIPQVVEAIKVLVQLDADKDAKDANGATALHLAAAEGQMEAIKALVQLGAQVDAQDVNGETPLQLSIGRGHHQAAQVLRELERTARTQQAARQDTTKALEVAEGMAAQLIEKEEREEAAAAQIKVRGAPLSPTFG